MYNWCVEPISDLVFFLFVSCVSLFYDKNVFFSFIPYLLLLNMEKQFESLPTTIVGLLLMAWDIYRDLGLSKEDRDEQIEILKILSLEEFRNYVITWIYLHKQRFT
jgi:hypothetical protein